MLPDVGAGTPLTAQWVVAALVLFGLTVGAMVIGALIWRWFTRPDERDEEQTKHINELRANLATCKVECAERRNDYVRRIEYEARMMRFDDKLTRVHKRIDQIALKLGVPNIEGDK